MYNLAIRKCRSPPLLAHRLKIFKWKFTTPPGIEPWSCWTRGRYATIWASAASFCKLDSFYYLSMLFPFFSFYQGDPVNNDHSCSWLLFLFSRSTSFLNRFSHNVVSIGCNKSPLCILCVFKMNGVIDNPADSEARSVFDSWMPEILNLQKFTGNWEKCMVIL